MGFLIDNVPNMKAQGTRYHSGPCPMCGGADRFVVKTFPDGREGWLCRGCCPGSYRTPENYLVERFGLSYEQARNAINDGGYHSAMQPPAPPQAPEKKIPPRRIPYWEKNAERLLQGYLTHPRRIEYWQAYKPLPEASIQSAELGVGHVPSNRCNHDRLIVPVRNEHGRIVCFRGRRIDCDCRDDRGKLLNWTTSAGWRLDDLPLYNLSGKKQGQTLLVVENQIDALMVDAYTGYHGVATMSTSYWLPAWTASLIATAPELIVVAYDNDPAGNGGGHHPAGQPVPISYGKALVRILKEEDLPAVLYDWRNSPAGDDIGSLIMRTIAGEQNNA